MSNYHILDAETVPRNDVEPPQFDPSTVSFGNTVDPAKRQAKLEREEAKFNENLSKVMSTNPQYNRILSFSDIYVDQHGEVISTNCLYGLENDKEILPEIADILSNEGIIVGWNVKNFDIRTLWIRGALEGVKIFSQPWDLLSPYSNKRAIDLRMIWAPDDKYYPMSKCAEAFGIPSKTKMTGADVYPAFLEGRHEDIKEYNMEDCEVGLAISQKLGFIG